MGLGQMGNLDVRPVGVLELGCSCVVLTERCVR